MSDLLSEVDDALRRERMEKLWNEHGKKFIAGLVLIVLATAVYSFYKSWSLNRQMDQTSILIDVLASPEFPKNIEGGALDEIDPGVAAIGLMNAAGVYVSKGETAKALALYEQVSGNEKVAADLRQIAVIAASRIQDPDQSPEVVKQHMTALEGIYNDAKSPWRYPAAVELANLKAHAGHDIAGARDILKGIMTSQDVPESLYAKVRELDRIYMLRQKQEEPKNAAQ